ncbi:hypothetical protein [Coleofasciculus sp. FACHB-501]|uniref:hypothetical protein n=1 Tax=Coleofasciculus sp. FACHB-501 TaxID=2692786 RepID=UPI0016824E13|nr:hypothetical protein [Coleofasciculus sp. FACHB-501]MBD1838887.1 hypothetical protein [Coleofasciculus sp. FACHB-501]
MNHFSPPATSKKQSQSAQHTLIWRVGAISRTIMLSEQLHNQQGFVFLSSLTREGTDVALV